MYRCMSGIVGAVTRLLCEKYTFPVKSQESEVPKGSMRSCKRSL